MRIVVAVHHFPPTFQAGSEQHALRLATALRLRGHAVRVFCAERIDVGPRDDLTWRDDVYEGLRVRRVSFDLHGSPDPRRWEYDNPWIGNHLRTLLQEERPDILHLFSGYLMTGRALHTAFDLGIRTVVTLTDFWFLCPRITMLRSDGTLSAPPFDPVTCARCLGEEQRRYRLPSRIVPGIMRHFWQHQHQRVQAMRQRQTFLRDTLQRVDAMLSPSEFVRNVFVGEGISSARITLCRQGIDLPPDLHVGESRAWPPSLRVGYIGQLAEQKGVHVLVNALRRLPDAPIVLRIYGDPRPFPLYVERLRRLAGHDRRIEFAGTYSGPQARREVLEGLDVTVVPSVWYENNPMSLNEALGHGVPVVATDVGSMPEMVIDGRNGLLFRREDAADLARQLRRLLDEPGLLAALRAGITPTPTVADETDHVEHIYRSLCVPRAPRPNIATSAPSPRR